MMTTQPAQSVLPDQRGYFGAYGGRFVPETLMAPLIELDEAYQAAQQDPAVHGLRHDGAVDVVQLDLAVHRVGQHARDHPATARSSK